MAQIPGSVPLTGKVAPTDTTDTFATHIDIYGEGGYMTVADQAERDAITTERRKQGMAVFQNSTNEMYVLQGGTANTNWVLFSGGSGAGDLQSVIESGGTYLGDDTKTKDVNIVVSSNPTVPNRNASFRTQVGALQGQPNFIVSRAQLTSQGVITDSQILTTISSTLRANSFPYSSTLSLDGLNGDANLRCWNEMRLTGVSKAQMDSDGDVEIFAGNPQQPQTNGSVLELSNTGTVNLAGSGGDVGIVSSDDINISALRDVNIAGAAGDIKFIGAGLGTPTVGDMLVAKNANGQVEWATSPINQTLQDVMDNGSVGDVTTNIDLITQDAAVASGRFCRMRTFLSGTTTRTLIQAQGLVGDSVSEVILTASDATAGPSGEESRIVLDGLTGAMRITATGMGLPAVGDVLSVGSATQYESTVEWSPGVQHTKFNITDAQVQTLHSLPLTVINIPAGKRLQVLSVMGYLDISYTNNRLIQLYYDGCNSGGGNTAIAFAKSLFTSMGDNTGAYIPVASGGGASASWGNNCSSLKVKLDLASGPPLMTPANGIDLYITYLIIDP